MLGTTRKVTEFNFMLDNFSSKIANWSWKTLSLVGRTTLVHSVLLTISLHSMACVPISLTILSKFEK